MKEVSEVSDASVNETPEIKALCEEYRSLNPKKIAIETRLKYVKAKIIELSNGKNVLSSGVNVMSYSKKGNIDYSLILGIQKMIEDETIEKYRKKTTTVTKFSIVG